MPAEHSIASVAKLRECYPKLPNERARRKSLITLDRHMRNFIARSPFLCMGTSSQQGADVTPRGDRPGFVHKDQTGVTDTVQEIQSAIDRSYRENLY